jgi:hypothetical protein
MWKENDSIMKFLTSEDKSAVQYTCCAGKEENKKWVIRMVVCASIYSGRWLFLAKDDSRASLANDRPRMIITAKRTLAELSRQ